MRASAPTAAGLKAAGVRGTRGSESKHDSNVGDQEDNATGGVLDSSGDGSDSGSDSKSSNEVYMHVM